MLPTSETSWWFGRSMERTCSTVARITRPVPMATMAGVSAASTDSSSAAARSATPASDCGAAGSVGTTSQWVRPKASFIPAASSMQAAMGCSSRKVISRSDRHSETKRCAVARETPSLRAISSWVLPAMK